MFSGVGIVFGATSGFFYAMSACFAKLLASKIHPVKLTWLRSTVLLLFNGLGMICFRKHLHITKKEMLYLLFSGIIILVGRSGVFYSYQTIPLTDAMTLLSASPVIALFYRIISERSLCKFHECFAIGSVIIGEFLCLQPTFIFGNMNMTSNKLGYFTALADSFFFVASTQLVKMASNLNITIICFIPFIPGFFICGVYLMIFDSLYLPLDYQDLIKICGFTISALFAVIFMTVGGVYDNVVMLSIGRSFDIVTSLFIDIVYFKKIPNTLSVCGATIVVGSIVIPPIVLYASSKKYVIQNTHSNQDE